MPNIKSIKTAFLTAVSLLFIGQNLLALDWNWTKSDKRTRLEGQFVYVEAGIRLSRFEIPELENYLDYLKKNRAVKIEEKLQTVFPHLNIGFHYQPGKRWILGFEAAFATEGRLQAQRIVDDAIDFYMDNTYRSSFFQFDLAYSVFQNKRSRFFTGGGLVYGNISSTINFNDPAQSKKITSGSLDGSNAGILLLAGYHHQILENRIYLSLKTQFNILEINRVSGMANYLVGTSHYNMDYEYRYRNDYQTEYGLSNYGERVKFDLTGFQFIAGFIFYL